MIDLKHSLYELTEAYPELIDILVGIGFAGVGNPVARNTHGREMTIPAGSERHGIDLGEVIAKLEEHGFEIKR